MTVGGQVGSAATIVQVQAPFFLTVHTLESMRRGCTGTRKMNHGPQKQCGPTKMSISLLFFISCLVPTVTGGGSCVGEASNCSKIPHGDTCEAQQGCFYGDYELGCAYSDYELGVC